MSRAKSSGVAIALAIAVLACLHQCESALVSKSTIATCNHGDKSEPTGQGGVPCEKKMLVSTTLRGGQVLACPRV